jgi:hypothetical protein
MERDTKISKERHLMAKIFQVREEHRKDVEKLARRKEK